MAECLNNVLSERRRALCGAVLTIVFISACDGATMTATYDVVIFTYLTRPIFDVYVGKTELGAAGEYPYNGRATTMGVTFPIGPQTITWALDGPEGAPDLGKKITAKNRPEIRPNEPGAHYLAVHIYPDETVEFVFSKNFPRLSTRGEQFDAEWEKKNGK